MVNSQVFQRWAVLLKRSVVRVMKKWTKLSPSFFIFRSLAQVWSLLFSLFKLRVFKSELPCAINRSNTKSTFHANKTLARSKSLLVRNPLFAPRNSLDAAALQNALLAWNLLFALGPIYQQPHPYILGYTRIFGASVGPITWRLFCETLWRMRRKHLGIFFVRWIRDWIFYGNTNCGHPWVTRIFYTYVPFINICSLGTFHWSNLMIEFIYLMYKSKLQPLRVQGLIKIMMLLKSFVRCKTQQK